MRKNGTVAGAAEPLRPAAFPFKSAVAARGSQGHHPRASTALQDEVKRRLRRAIRALENAGEKILPVTA